MVGAHVPSPWNYEFVSISLHAVLPWPMWLTLGWPSPMHRPTALTCELGNQASCWEPPCSPQLQEEAPTWSVLGNGDSSPRKATKLPA